MTDADLVAAAIVREWPPGSLANALVHAVRDARAANAELQRKLPPPEGAWVPLSGVFQVLDKLPERFTVLANIDVTELAVDALTALAGRKAT